MLPQTKVKQKGMEKVLNAVERIGNRLPHPLALFAYLTLALIVISAICSWAGVSVTGEMIDPATGELTEQTVTAVNLLSRDGLVTMLTSLVSNFTGFAPLGVVLVTMLGVGCAEGSGFLSALMKKLVRVTPRRIITPMLVFLGVLSNVASDIGYVVLIPIGALVFLSYGRHPLAGLAAAFSGVSGGYSANLIIGALDPLMAGISTEAAHLIDPQYQVNATANWYFMIASTFLIVILGTLVTDKWVEPHLGPWKQEEEGCADMTSLSPAESRGLKYALLTLLLLILLLLGLTLPPGALLRNADTGSLTVNSPLINGIIPLIALLFFIPSVVYGRVAGTYTGSRSVCAQLEKNMSAMGSYIALVFVAAQFIGFFQYSRLGTIVAIGGADLLRSSGISGPLLMVLFVLFTALVNLVMGSSSAKWTILAPVFVPLFMLMGYTPELTQMAYRIGDSCTNVITPLMSYFAMVTVLAQKYAPKAGVGTLAATMLPYSLVFLVGWLALLLVWMWLGLPLGPGAGLTL